MLDYPLMGEIMRLIFIIAGGVACVIFFSVLCFVWVYLLLLFLRMTCSFLARIGAPVVCGLNRQFKLIRQS